MSNNKLIGKKSLFSENIKKILKKKKLARVRAQLCLTLCHLMDYNPPASSSL